MRPPAALPRLAGAALLSLALLPAPGRGERPGGPPPSPAVAEAERLWARYRTTLDHGDLECVEDSVEAALAKAPSDFALRKFRTRVLLAHHEFEDLEAEARALLDQKPDDPELWGALGDALFDVGRTSEAAQAYDLFAAARPTAAALSRVALVAERTGDDARALRAMDLAAGAAKASDPDGFAWCRARAARLLLKTGRVADAEGRLAEALLVAPGHPAALAAAAECAARRGLLASAATLAERALAVSPDVSTGAALVAYRRAMGDAAGEARARRGMETLEAIQPPDHRLVHRFLALYFADFGDTARAVAMTERELRTRRDPGGFEAYAWALYRAGRPSDAVAPIREALASGVKDPVLEFRAGAILLAAGETVEGRRLLVRALAADPRFHVLYADEARALLAPRASASASVEVSAPRALRSLEDLDAADLVGIADSASSGAVPADRVRARETHRPGDVLESVPGLLVSQHSGEGKANQYYLRGFNLDHGTDLASTVAGVPVNLPTNAHGQGYADDNFLVPELVSSVRYRKGPYFADEGDFSAAGAVHVDYVDALERPVAEVGVGGAGWRRSLFAGSLPAAGGTLLAALEVAHNDGPWTHPDDLRRVNGLVRWSSRGDGGVVAVTGSFYQAAWNATDQIPARAVSEGLLGRYDAVDPTDGGRTHRYALSASREWTGEGTRTRVEAWAIDYGLDLWSDFTYALKDPVHGDQFQQSDRRLALGGKASRGRTLTLLGKDAEATVGLDVRNDNVPTLSLLNTQARAPLSTVRTDHVSETSAAVWGQLSVQPATWLRAVVGLRGDALRANVSSSLPGASGDVTRAILSPKLTLVLGPFSRTEVYLNGGYGHHSNDARGATLRVDPATGEAAAPAAPLVRAKGAEVGVRDGSVAGVQTTLALWILDVDSELVFSGDSGVTTPSRPSRRAGVEWSAVFRPAPWLALDADAAWSRARFTEHAAEGDRVPGAVQGVASAGVTVDAASGLSGSVRLRYFGPRDLTADGTVRSGASTLVNLSARWQAASWARLGLDVYNVFDAAASDVAYFYTSRLPGESASGVADVHAHPVDPRTVRAGLTLTF